MSAACAKDRPALQGGLGSFYYTKRNGKFHTFVNTESHHSVISFTLLIACAACPLGHNQKNEGNIGKTTRVFSPIYYYIRNNIPECTNGKTIGSFFLGLLLMNLLISRKEVENS